MIVNKIIIGFVIQTFDTDTGLCTEQDFVEGDDVSFEDEAGEPIEDQDLSFPCDMKQPTPKVP